MFAGPNGSGKSTLIKEIRKEYLVGFYVNADDIQAALQAANFIDLAEYLPRVATQREWNQFKATLSKEDSRLTSGVLDSISITGNILTVETAVDSYTAAVIAEFLRFLLLACEETFSFETVMSHESKISFLKRAKSEGFKTYLYFIGTKDPSINIDRVRIRKSKGGHEVADDKIVKRYHRALDLLAQAFINVDRAYIFDNSSDDEMQNILIEKNGDHVEIYVDEIPEWVQLFLLDRLNTD